MKLTKNLVHSVSSLWTKYSIKKIIICERAHDVAPLHLFVSVHILLESKHEGNNWISPSYKFTSKSWSKQKGRKL